MKENKTDQYSIEQKKAAPNGQREEWLAPHLCPTKNGVAAHIQLRSSEGVRSNSMQHFR